MAAVEWVCTKCGNGLTGVAQQLGKKKKDRKIYCLKCTKGMKR